MRIGLSASPKHNTPIEWAKKNKELGCGTVVFPVDYRAEDAMIDAYATAAKENNLMIAEVGVWRNPIAPLKEVRTEGLDYCKRQLELADRLGANCCVNVSGSMGERWDGAYKDNFSRQTWSKMVKSIQEIIDSVHPKNTYYTIEPMPWMYPTGPDEYVRLLEDVGRDRFAVHMDIFNWITTPKKYFFQEEFMEECFEKLGKYIKSCHIKDVLLQQEFTIMFQETKCGEGNICLEKYALLANQYNKNMPMIIEHLHSETEYLQSLEYVKTRLGDMID
ncbi:sugar phosphate isomerase/epimerase [Lachnospiraceae bacterium ZAX-1]